jgi:hypothetical protein
MPWLEMLKHAFTRSSSTTTSSPITGIVRQLGCRFHSLWQTPSEFFDQRET